MNFRGLAVGSATSTHCVVKQRYNLLSVSLCQLRTSDESARNLKSEGRALAPEISVYTQYVLK